MFRTAGEGTFVRGGLRGRLAKQSCLIGLFVSDPSPALVELAGHFGYDWVFIDCEHGPLDLETVEHMIRAAETAGIIPIVRLPSADPGVVHRYLDAGAMGLLVPHLTLETIRPIIAAAKFHPLGHRGLSPRARAADLGFRFSGQQYAEWANAETVIFGIVEDARVLDELPELLTIDGLDGLVIGPSDLAQSMGLTGQLTHPKVLDVAEAITRRTLASPKLLCRPPIQPGDAERFIGLGIPMIFETSTAVFARGAKDLFLARQARSGAARP